MAEPGAGAGTKMRELRVEDALLYLDQVKIEFGDRPHIYNEFLDIMKTFKTQQIDTPGVIRRVSNLFQGNKKLVLGFNTFLPEGYKIELPTDGVGPPVAVFRAPGQTVTHILSEPSPSPGGMSTANSQSMTGSQVVGSQGPSGQQPSMISHGGMPSQQGGPGAAHRPGVPPHAQQPLHASQPPMRHGGPAGPAHAQQQHPSQAATPGQQRAQQPHGASMIGQQQQGPKVGGQMGDEPASSAGASPYQQHPSGPHTQPAMQIQHSHQVQGGPRGSQPQQHQTMPADGPTRVRAPLDPQNRSPGQQHQPRGVLPRQSGSIAGGMVAQQPPSQDVKVGQPSSRMGLGGTHPPQQALPSSGPPRPGVMQAGSNPHSMHAPAPPQPQGQQQPPLEFDHAINYVTTIKKRFASEPETYKKFLEILHTYQKEQRGIKEVLDEVSILFADHPDLLKEFTYFLPDAVQAQAKAQLEQVANEAEARKRAASSKQAIMQQAQGMQKQAQGMLPRGANVAPGSRSLNLPPAATSVPIPFGATQGRSEEREMEICKRAVYGNVSFAPVRPPRKNELLPPHAAAKHGRPTMLPPLPRQPTTSETAFFERVKHHLNRRELAPDKGKRHTPYTEFLKCLHLFGAGILNKDELILLLRGLFMQGHAPKSGANAGGGASNPSIASDAHDLLREFEEILIGRGPYADQETMFKAKSKYGSLRTRDFDFSHSERPTPSYCMYPADYPNSLFVSNSGQTEEDNSVLNNSLFCVGPDRGSRMRLSYSPEDYDGIRARRNTYEEAMFQIEDKRFEFDMAIERNALAMRQLELIVEEVVDLRENEENDGQPIGRLQYQLKGRSLNSIQINAIGRLYGDSGDEVIEHLKRNPLAVLPIVFQRLRQKDIEWRKTKRDFINAWKTATEVNYEGSMDYLCHFYRRKLELSFAPERLREDCKRARSFYKHPEKRADHPATSRFVPTFALENEDPDALLFQPNIYVHVGPASLAAHRDAMKAIILQVRNKTQPSKADRERVGRILAEFMVPWFDYPVHWVLDEVRRSFRGELSPIVAQYSPGQRVRTAFGDGTIVSFLEGNPASGGRYRIKFSYGVGSIRPSAVMHAIPEPDKSRFVRKDGYMEKQDEELLERPFGEKLDNRFKLLFGTDCVYIFLRLYCLLVTILSDTHEYIEAIEPIEDPATRYYNPIKKEEEKDEVKAKLDYNGIVSSLYRLINHQVDGKEFEAFCRRVSKSKVYQMAALPKLVEKCTDALVQVAREDVLLNLYDYCQHQGMDPIHLRSQCLDSVPDASYRIQLDTQTDYIFFSFVPETEELLTCPAGERHQERHDRGNDEGQMDDADDADGEGYHNDADGDYEAPQAKRAKLK